MAIPSLSAAYRLLAGNPVLWLPGLIAGALLYFAIASIGTLQSKFIYFNF